MATVTVVDRNNLDISAYVKLQKAAFGAILKAAKASDAYMKPEYYRWKFNPPAGLGRSAVVYENGELAASVTMIPQTIRFGGKSFRGWLFGDVATHPDFRGRGLFDLCLKGLETCYEENDFIYGLPNRNSIPGFIKVGWRLLTGVTTWFHPMPALFRHVSGDNPRIHEIATVPEKKMDAYAEALVSEGRPMVVRNARYMKWRYFDHPFYHYSMLVFSDGSDPLAPGAHWRGMTVFRKASVKGRNWFIPMEIRGETPSVIRALLFAAMEKAGVKPGEGGMMLNTGIGLPTGLLSGFLPAPGKLMPKQQVLMGVSKGEASDVLYNDKWLIQTGDWDVF